MVQYSEFIGLYIFASFIFLVFGVHGLSLVLHHSPGLFTTPIAAHGDRRLSFICTPNAHNQWLTIHATCYTPTRNFDVDVDVDGACIAAGDHIFFGIWSNSSSSPIPLPVVGGVLGGRSS